jgi:hypothetical protein
MSAKEVFSFIGDVLTEAAKQKQLQDIRRDFLVFLSLDRSSAMQEISSVVQKSSAKELAEFEQYYLFAASLQLEPDAIYRATELYGWLKDQEHERYGHWRGFADQQLGGTE